jgi:hypothetical protein
MARAATTNPTSKNLIAFFKKKYLPIIKLRPKPQSFVVTFFASKAKIPA